jgi:hypothetical protein
LSPAAKVCSRPSNFSFVVACHRLSPVRFAAPARVRAVCRRSQPGFAFGPAGPLARAPPLAVTDTRGPRVIPYLKPSPTRTPPAPPPTPPRARLPSVARTPRSTPVPL